MRPQSRVETIREHWKAGQRKASNCIKDLSVQEARRGGLGGGGGATSGLTRGGGSHRRTT